MCEDGGGGVGKLGAYHEGPCFALKEYVHYPECMQKILGPWSDKISSFKWLCGDGTGEGQPGN